jgi:hypothetical protein
MYTFKIFTNVDAVKWNNDLMKSQQANFFQSAEFLTQEVNSGRFPNFIYVFDNSKVVGQLGLTIVRTGTIRTGPFFRKFTKIASSIASRAEWGCGPIIHVNDEESRLKILRTLISAVDQIADDNDLVYIEGKSPPYDSLVNERYLNELKDHGYDKENCMTLTTHLENDIDEIWKNVTKKTRGDVERAKRRGIVIKELENYGDLEKYLMLYQKWTKTKGYDITEPFQQITKLWNEHKSGIRKIFLAYHDEKLISGLNVGCFNHIAITHQVISSYEEKTSLGGTLLTWYALEWAKNSGFRIYDFSGACMNEFKKRGTTEKDEIPDNSLLFYKKKWGGEEIPWYHFTKINRKYSYWIMLTLSKLLIFYERYKKRKYEKSKTTYK